MSAESIALASTRLQSRQTLSVAALKQSVAAERAIVNLIAQTTGTQPLNNEGRGSSVNLLV